MMMTPSMSVSEVDTTRDRLLEAAVQLFAARGFRGASLRELAEAVGITPPALYNHFSSKEALYRAAVRETFERSGGRLLAALQTQRPPMERLREFLRELATETRERTDFRHLLMRELLDGDREHLEFLARQVFDPVMEPLMELVRELSPRDDAFLVAMMIIGIVKQCSDMMVLQPCSRLDEEGDRNPQQIADQALRLIGPHFSVINGKSEPNREIAR